MEDRLTIWKNAKLPESQNYEFLRREGLKYIEELSSDLWTDYNTHDPGITILEALCYAITELGYRTSFDIKDILSDENGKIDAGQIFFKASEIFNNTPYSVEDYRKILIDLDGVRNAWLLPFRNADCELINEPNQEVPIYANCKKDALVYDVTEHPVKLHGLYKVILELDIDDELGDLNNGNIIYRILKPDHSEIPVQINLPGFYEADGLYNYSGTQPKNSAPVVTYSEKQRKWNISFSTGPATRQKDFSKTAVLQSGRISKEDIELVRKKLQSADTLSEILNAYRNKLDKIGSIISEAKNLLHKNRNLCEDFIGFETVCKSNIAFCADIAVETSLNIEELYAKIIMEVENYLCPDIKFYSLKEMQQDKIPTDIIFEGPVLTHGFIKTEELKRSKMREKVYSSDIINFIMDIPGVISVKDVALTQYNSEGFLIDDTGEIIDPEKNDNGQISKRWCVQIKPGCIPAFNLSKSKVFFYKGKLPFIAQDSLTRSALNYLRGREERNKLGSSNGELELPLGEFHALSDYRPLQFEFPLTYGIGDYGLPLNASAERRAQAKQLKSYLQFYDQLLANFFSQLNNARQLFSTAEIGKQTYFTQYIEELKSTGEVDAEKEMYSDEIKLKSVLSSYPDDTTLTEAFETLVERKEIFYERRNRFIDHLMSRFAHSFNDFTLMLFEYKSADKYKEASMEELIEKKLSFLNNFPELSGQRSRAHNYIDSANIWNSNNVSGYEKRISTMAGLENSIRRFMFCFNKIEILEETFDENNKAVKKYYFEMRDETDRLLLQSTKRFDKHSDLELIISQLPESGEVKKRYKFDETAEGVVSYRLENEKGEVIAIGGSEFNSKEEAETTVEQIIALILSGCQNDDEGMHLVEHILLRPRFTPLESKRRSKEKSYQLYEVCLNKDCDFCGEEDPYSFRISLVLPYWKTHFKNLGFRSFFETMARTEAPAHCMVKICWIDNTHMQRFEIAYKEWLIALGDYEADLIKDEDKKKTLMETNNNLIEIMQKLHSEYPPAVLHDCGTGDTDPVLLGTTVLGTYKN
ncbi:MAG: hypothetical protein ACHQFW_03020 [Chitinophagales bacterium]